MPSRAPIDWSLVRMKFEAGQSAYAISQDLGGRPTKQGIAKRAAREGWQQGNGSELTVAQGLPIVERARDLSGPTKCSAERIAIILAAVSQGAPEGLAASAAGISADTLRKWKRQDPQLGEQLRIARAAKISEWIGHIDRAAHRDWKAADRLISAAPEMTDWSQAGSHGGVTVVLNIDRDGKGVTVEGETVPR